LARKKKDKLLTGSKAVIKVGGQQVAWATGVAYSTNHITIPSPPPQPRNPFIFVGGISTYSVYVDPLAFDKHYLRKKRLGPLIEFMRLLRSFGIVDDKWLQEVKLGFVRYTKEHRSKGRTPPKNSYLKHVTKRDKKKGKARIT
jgi:hypothetical protein